MQDPTKAAIAYQRKLFQRLDEFFFRATGKNASVFATIDTFGDEVRKNAQQLRLRGEAAFKWVGEELGALYAKEGADAFRYTQELGGVKLVLGGNNRFGKSQLTSISTSILYSDTVLIPDPVMPWLEKDRREEKFRHVLLLKAVHALLSLKPLVDADLHYPAVLVFPSWEKTLEAKDEYTQKSITQLITDVFSNFLGKSFESLSEVGEYAARNTDQFLSIVDTNHLFVAPNGPLNERLTHALERYQRELETWRSQEWMSQRYNNLPIYGRVINGIAERLGPIFHLLENAEEITSHPLVCLEQHAHYFKLVADTNNARLEKIGVLDSRTRALINAFSSRRLRWLGNLPSDTLAKIRQDNENVSFRKQLFDALGRLHDSTLSNVDKVATEIYHELERAFADHEKQLRSVEEKYNRSHSNTLLLGLAAVGVALMPTLAPFLGSVAAPFALAAKYGKDKIDQLAEKRTLTQSLVGVLATAALKNS